MTHPINIAHRMRWISTLAAPAILALALSTPASASAAQSTAAVTGSQRAPAVVAAARTTKKHHPKSSWSAVQRHRS
jgi:hypothetical protein